MKIDELSSVFYSADLHEGTAGVSVGWLGTETPATGAVDPGLVEAIAHLCDYHSINHYMGLHECDLCRGHEAGADVNGRGNFGADSLGEARSLLPGSSPDRGRSSDPQ